MEILVFLLGLLLGIIVLVVVVILLAVHFIAKQSRENQLEFFEKKTEIQEEKKDDKN